MASLNRILLIGSIQNDPENRVTNGGDQFSKFILTVDRPERTDGMKAEPDNIDIVAWRQVAESASDLKSGDLVMVDGRIVTRTQEDDSGNRKYFTEVDAKEIRKVSGATGSGVSAQLAADNAFEAPQSVEKKDVEEISESDFDFGDQLSSDEKAEAEEEVPF